MHAMKNAMVNECNEECNVTEWNLERYVGRGVGSYTRMRALHPVSKSFKGGGGEFWTLRVPPLLLGQLPTHGEVASLSVAGTTCVMFRIHSTAAATVGGQLTTIGTRRWDRGTGNTLVSLVTVAQCAAPSQQNWSEAEA